MKNGKYELIIAPSDYPGKKYREIYAYEHHIIWWENFGEIVSSGFEIHHLDGNHRNNNIDNLCVLTKTAHRKIHGSLITKKMVSIECSFCGQLFLRAKDNVSNKKSRDQSNFYCNRSCMGSGQIKKNIPQ